MSRKMMKQQNFIFILALLAMFSVSNCFAAEFPIQPLGLTLTIPDGWKVEEKDGGLSTYAPDGNIILAFTVTSGTKGLNAWYVGIKQQVQGLSGGDEESLIELSDGVFAKVRRGTGSLDDMGQVYVTTFIIERNNQLLLAAILKASEPVSNYSSEAVNILKSIRRVN